MNVLRAVLWKDLVTEWRQRDRVVAMAVFALTVVVILYMTAPPGIGPEARQHVPGLLWVAFTFASILGLNRSFALELENDALAALAMASGDRGFIFLGKALANFVLLLGVQAFPTFAFGMAFGIDFWPILAEFAVVAALGALGLSALGTLFSAMAVRTTYREVMLPLLMLPLMVPVLLGAVRATEGLLLDGEIPGSALQLLLVADGVFGIISYLGFEAVLDE